MPSDVLGGHLETWTDEDERNVQLARAFLSRFTHKPGWHFDVSRRPELPCPVVLTVGLIVLDSRSMELYGEDVTRLCDLCGGVRGYRIPIGGSYPIPNLARMQQPEGMFFDFLRRCIDSVEGHETDEWFRVDGVLVHDPHEGDK